jgi:pimeloyl-ACP methyl ester carboxylesterase
MRESMMEDRMRRPSRVLRDLEIPRAAWEFAACCATWPAMRSAPHGDGHGVLVLPGFMAADSSTWPLRTVLRRLDYDARPWGLGRNFGPTDAITEALPRHLEKLYSTTGRRVSLVGMSLGGVFARDLARSHADLVRQVITLGSPFRLPVRHSGPSLTHAAWLYRMLRPWHGQRDVERPPEDDLPVLSVPSTAIYSRTDGVVPWRACIEREAPMTQCIEVRGSHIGLGHNPMALAVIAGQLAHPERDLAAAVATRPVRRPARRAEPRSIHRIDRSRTTCPAARALSTNPRSTSSTRTSPTRDGGAATFTAFDPHRTAGV